MTSDCQQYALQSIKKNILFWSDLRFKEEFQRWSREFLYIIFSVSHNVTFYIAKVHLSQLKG